MNDPTNKSSEVEDLASHALPALLGPQRRSDTSPFSLLAEQNQQLLAGEPGAIRASLGRQTIVLEALFYHLILAADKSSRPEVTAMALKGALAAHRALIATFASIQLTEVPK